MTGGWISFEGQITPLEWGKSVYTVLPLPHDISDQLTGTRRVEVEINDHPLNLALTKSPVIAETFLYTGKQVLRDIGIAPGDIVDVRLRPAQDGDVDVPEDVAAALRAGGRTEAWDALTPGKQRGLLHQVNSAKRADTRTRRIGTLIDSLDNPDERRGRN